MAKHYITVHVEQNSPRLRRSATGPLYKSKYRASAWFGVEVCERGRFAAAGGSRPLVAAARAVKKLLSSMYR